MSVAFDHLMVLVADEATAAREFSDAGFTVTPRSELPGMANRLVCFPSGMAHAASFIELLSVERPDAVPPVVRDLIGQSAGPMAMVFAVPDLDVCRRTLAECGALTAEPLAIRRRWALPSGRTLDVALDVVIGNGVSLPFKWVVVKHHTVDHYRRTEFTAHANGYRALAAVVVSVADPLHTAETMERLFGCGLRRVGACAVVDLQNAHLLLLPQDASPHLGTEAGSSIVGVILQDGFAEIDPGDLAHKFSDRMRDETIGALELGGLTLFCSGKRHSV